MARQGGLRAACAVSEHTVIGLDLSLTGAGVGAIQADWSIIDGEPRYLTERYGRKGTRQDTLEGRFSRIEDIANSVRQFIVNELESTPHLAVIEDMPFGTPGGSTFDRAGLWWMVYQQLDRLAIKTITMNVAKVKIYATGRGNKVDKDEVMLAVARRYPDAPIRNNDEADAFVLAAMGARLLGSPIEKSMPQTHLRALDGMELT